MMKRVLSLLLAIALMSSGIVFAATDTITTESIRVFNAGAEISVELTGTPSGHVSVVMLEPGTNLPDVTTDYAVFNEGVAHVDSIDLGETGKTTFKYIADAAGIYTVHVKGAEIDYSSTNNDSPTVNPDRIYVESWTSSTTYSHPDLNYMVSVSKAQLDTYGVEAIARSVKEKLDVQPEGRKTLFIKNDFGPRKHSNGENIWWDEGTALVKGMLESFFKAYSDIGGKIDFMYSDFEQDYSMWGLTGISSEERYAAIEKIYTHEKYPQFEAELIKRGYDTKEDGDIPLSSIWNYYSPADNYQKFNAVCSSIASDYYREAIFEPAKKYFANVKYAEYGKGDGKLWLGGYGTIGQHPSYNAGNGHTPGTHSAPPLYSKRVRGYSYQNIVGILGEEGSYDTKISMYEGAGSNFLELQGTIAMLRTSANASDNAITPWVATEAVSTETFSDPRYRSEMIIHVALHNPDRILHYNPGYDDEFSRDEQSEILMTALDEVNDLVAYEDRRSLNADQADLKVPFAISGMYANGKNIWRITPDNTIITGSFLTSAEGADPVFDAGDVTITFPQGRIITVEDTVSDIGYWVETPQGVTPVMEYAESIQTESELASVDFYDVKYGQKADLATETTVDAVASYKGFYGDKLNFIAAKYDENGAIIDVDIKECGIYTPYGNASFLGISKDLDTAEIKFFLWEDGTIRPLANNEM